MAATADLPAMLDKYRGQLGAVIQEVAAAPAEREPDYRLAHLEAAAGAGADDAGAFPEALTPRLASLVQGSALPLGDVAAAAAAALGDDSCAFAEKAAAKIRLVAERKAYGIAPKKGVAAAEDASVLHIWRWEVVAAEAYFGDASLKAIKAARAARGRVGKKAKALGKLVDALVKGDAAKALAEEEKVLKISRDEDAARLKAEAADRKKREKEAEKKAKEDAKALKKRESEDAKAAKKRESEDAREASAAKKKKVDDGASSASKSLMGAFLKKAPKPPAPVAAAPRRQRAPLSRRTPRGGAKTDAFVRAIAAARADPPPLEEGEEEDALDYGDDFLEGDDELDDGAPRAAKKRSAPRQRAVVVVSPLKPGEAGDDERQRSRALRATFFFDPDAPDPDPDPEPEPKAKKPRKPRSPWAGLSLDSFPVVTRFDHKMRYVVKKQGAYLRQGGSLQSAKVCTLAGGTRVLCDKSWPLDASTTRVHVLEPAVGWVSLKCLRDGRMQLGYYLAKDPALALWHERLERGAAASPRARRRLGVARRRLRRAGSGAVAAGGALGRALRRVAFPPDAVALDGAARYHPERRPSAAAMARFAYGAGLANVAAPVSLEQLRGAAARFCFAPSKRTWEQNISDACRCPQDFLAPSYDENVPAAPPGPGCWLIPTEDGWALRLCERRADYERLGWRVLAGDLEETRELMDKVRLRKRARRMGLEHCLPASYATLRAARFPCIVKTAVGDFGSTVRFARDARELDAAISELKLDARRMNDAWLVQELCEGPVEYSASCVVRDGRILDVVATRYTYDAAVYVWPRVEERRELRVVDAPVPENHLDVMAALLRRYTGICNFNYKLRGNGELCIFEVNVRSGEDLACDVPPDRLRCLLERLDGTFPPLGRDGP
ncbi:Chromatin assembly factor 1 subunit A [Aureococcus anophagefferens]|uniref:Chromatin assembly factor 1 subunit A n=1 Tax=Aureococcus anophagefferens TaxID=44056 RepID=A0ABR1FWD5_AURAN